MRRVLMLTFAGLIAITGYLYFVIPSYVSYQTAHNPSNEFLYAPYRYRILQPALYHAVGADSSETGTIAFTALLHSVLLALFIPGVYVWLTRWTNADRAMTGVWATVALLLLAYRIYFLNVSTLLEAVCIVYALLQKRLFWIVVLTIIASLNRETGFLIPLFYLALYPRQYKQAFMVGAIYGVITLAIHITMGSAGHTLGIEGTLAYNLGNWSESVVTLLVFAPLPALVITNYRTSPAALKRFAWCIGLFVVMNIVGGAWNEFPRLMLPVMPLALSIGLR